MSLRAVSRRHGFGSVATLSMILAGQRKITAEVADKLVDILKLKGARRKYFLALTERARTTDPEKRARLEETLFFFRKMATCRELDWKQYEFLSQWYFVALFVLVGLPGFSRDAVSLARRLGRGVTAKQVEHALSTMLSLGLLVEKDGTLRQAEGPVLKTGEDVQHLSVRQFHRQVLRKASEAIELPRERREFTGLTFACAPSQLPKLKEKIRQFREEIDHFAESLPEKEEVYQLSLQLFPLTRKEGHG